MSARAAAIVEVIRSALGALDSLEPTEQQRIYSVLVTDLRSRRPMAVSLGALGPPTETIRDPRNRQGA